MKKYKLVREYPDSPKLEGIAEETKEGYKCTIKNCTHYIQKSTVEDYPDYWQEVVEKDYEILSFIGKISSLIYHKLEGADRYKSIGANFTYTLETALGNYSQVSIYSIKRLSDGEVFTIGDRVTVNYKDIMSIIPNSHEGTITLFTNTYDFAHLAQIPGPQPIYRLEKAKLPLFTTEDGVEIFNTKIACGVAIKEGSESTVQAEDYWRLFDIRPNWPYKGVNKEYWKMFSTKEAAEEYILMNKPCLSITDILTLGMSNRNLYHLKQLVRNKLAI